MSKITIDRALVKRAIEWISWPSSCNSVLASELRAALDVPLTDDEITALYHNAKINWQTWAMFARAEINWQTWAMFARAVEAEVLRRLTHQDSQNLGEDQRP